MIIIARRFEFDMGHRVFGHEGKCKWPHGHRYACEVHLTGELDQIGRVIDYGEIKNVLGSYIDDKLDHGFAIYKEDKQLLKAFKQLDDSRLIVLPFNPTAENLAAHLTREFKKLVPQVKGVTLYETPNCKATYGI